MPKSVLDKAAAVSQAGGLVFIDKMMQDLPELLGRNREVLDDVSATFILVLETGSKPSWSVRP